MVKKRVPLVNNDLSGKVVLCINIHKKYASEIANELKIPQSNVFRELWSLTQEDYLIAHTEDNNQLNKKMFSIDWGKMAYRFNVYCKDKMGVNIPKKYYDIRHNKYLIELMKISFVQNYKFYKEKRFKLRKIKDIFDDLLYQIVYHIPPHNDISLIEKAKTDRKIRLFLNYTRFLERNTAPNPSDMLEKFYDDIVSKSLVIRTSKKDK